MVTSWWPGIWSEHGPEFHLNPKTRGFIRICIYLYLFTLKFCRITADDLVILKNFPKNSQMFPSSTAPKGPDAQDRGLHATSYPKRLAPPWHPRQPPAAPPWRRYGSMADFPWFGFCLSWFLEIFSTTSSKGKRGFSGVFCLEYKGFLLVFQAANPKMGLGHSWGESRENISGLWKCCYHGKWLVWRWLGHQHLGLTIIDVPSKSINGRPSPGPAWQCRASMAKHQRYATPGVDIMFNCIVYTKLNLRMVCHVVIWFHI